MLGTIWINTGLGLFASVVTLVASLASNVWLVSLERAAVAFVLFFVIAFPFRWLTAVITQTSTAPLPKEAGAMAEDTPPHSTTRQAAPEEEEFSPLASSGLERIRPVEDPATVAEVVRRLTDE